jgi:hypothetical protein
VIPNPFTHRPYVDWSIDRWKVLIIFLLFCLLVAGALMWPMAA